MSGPELAERLRAIRTDFVVLFMSGYTGRRHRPPRGPRRRGPLHPEAFLGRWTCEKGPRRPRQRNRNLAGQEAPSPICGRGPSKEPPPFPALFLTPAPIPRWVRSVSSPKRVSVRSSRPARETRGVNPARGGRTGDGCAETAHAPSSLQAWQPSLSRKERNGAPVFPAFEEEEKGWPTEANAYGMTAGMSRASPGLLPHRSRGLTSPWDGRIVI